MGEDSRAFKEGHPQEEGSCNEKPPQPQKEDTTEAAQEKKTKVSEMQRKEKTYKLLTEKTEKTSAVLKQSLQQADRTVAFTRKTMKVQVGELKAKNAQLAKIIKTATTSTAHLTHVAARLRGNLHKAQKAVRLHKERNTKGISEAKKREAQVKKKNQARDCCWTEED